MEAALRCPSRLPTPPDPLLASINAFDDFPGLELVGPSKRMFCGISIEFFFAGGGALLGGIAYLIRNWRTLQLVIYVPGFIFLTYFW